MPKVKHSKYYRNWKLSVLYWRPFHPINNYTVQSKILEFFPMMGVKCWWKPLFSKRNGLICLYSSRFLSVFHNLIISFFLKIFSWFLLTIHFVIYYLTIFKILGVWSYVLSEKFSLNHLTSGDLNRSNGFKHYLYDETQSVFPAQIFVVMSKTHFYTLKVSQT